MYRVYAQDPQARINLGIRRRLAPLLGNNRRKIELMNALLLSLPGTPVIYYGDEIGMGDNFYLGDRNGVRTPMQWSPDRNAGFSRANPQQLYLPVIIDPEYHYEAVNVEVQQNNPQSLLWWMKRIAQPAQAVQGLRPRQPASSSTPTTTRSWPSCARYGERAHPGGGEPVALRAARGAEPARLRGPVPGRDVRAQRLPRRSARRPTRSPSGPHGFYWFALEKAPPTAGAGHVPAAPEARPAVAWTEAAAGAFAERSAGVSPPSLPAVLHSRPWFWGKSRELIRAPRSSTRCPVADLAALALVQVDYVDGEPERYLLPVAAALGPRGEDAGRAQPGRRPGPPRGRDGRARGRPLRRHLRSRVLRGAARRHGPPLRDHVAAAGELRGLVGSADPQDARPSRPAARPGHGRRRATPPSPSARASS